MLTFILLIVIIIAGFIGSYGSLIIARYWNVVDDPRSDEKRKIQKFPVPLLGATGFIVVSALVTSIIAAIAKYNLWGAQYYFYQGLYQPISYIWVLVSVLILAIAGFLDDTKRVSIFGRFVLTGSALLISIFLAGLKIEALSYPFNDIVPVFPLLPELLAFLWVGFCLFSTKVLDGHDGLVTSVGIVGFLTISSVATFPNVNQPLIIIFGLVWAASMIGFLPFNFPNARLYLGDGGSMVVGFMIGVLSILSGAKIATAGSVIGWFVIDLVFVWFRRVIDGRNPLTSSDRFHWHQRLTDSGFNKLQVLSLTILIVLITSRLGLMLVTQNKLIVLVAQGIVLLIIFGLTYALSTYRVKSLTKK